MSGRVRVTVMTCSCNTLPAWSTVELLIVTMKIVKYVRCRAIEKLSVFNVSIVFAWSMIVSSVLDLLLKKLVVTMLFWISAAFSLMQFVPYFVSKINT